MEKATTHIYEILIPRWKNFEKKQKPTGKEYKELTSPEII